MPSLNPTLANMGVYASKTISQAAKAMPGVLNLSIGEPEFGPPEFVLAGIAGEDLTLENFIDSVKRYEHSRGSAALREAISRWYARRYGLAVDPEKEILVTHGGVEAIALAILSSTAAGDAVAVTDPSYMLYERSIATLGRVPVAVRREPAEDEYAALGGSNAAFAANLCGARAIVVNSPENPSGYVSSAADWATLAGIAEKSDAWIIHDEVYDTMAFEREHVPARSIAGLRDRTVMVNSFSKKFGTPGLRIGWIVADEKLIEIASKAHDYLYLGVNILYERVATRLLSDPRAEAWFGEINAMLRARVSAAHGLLTPETGFTWDRPVLGGMFLFPRVRELYELMPPERRAGHANAGEAVARYLLEMQRVATVPGSVYGREGDDRIRLVICPPADVYDRAIDRLAKAVGVPA